MENLYIEFGQCAQNVCIGVQHCLCRSPHQCGEGKGQYEGKCAVRVNMEGVRVNVKDINTQDSTWIPENVYLAECMEQGITDSSHSGRGGTFGIL